MCVLQQFIGTSPWHWKAAFHGLFAFILLISFVWSFEAIIGISPASIRRLKIGTIVMSAASFLTIVWGTWLYIGYRLPDNARAWLIKNAPYVHKFGMEFKEFIALFSLPLAVTAAYIVWTMGEELIENKYARYALLVCVTLGFIYIAAAFGLGAAITKVKAVS
ncbi:hypothetical protein SAMN00808754_2169 [Thermanaeromonas toyohensis ToBE]|uniref:Uncharacterized protein n=1 Tax=Thermanaeromonas toyohensis ToBE TaxID=698762 RepID=A0A1W1VXQ5_9FIRM|nr:hypothetical protein SAMN00808754_2169 [Thermanaeromonas toyohensis ToBE]